MLKIIEEEGLEPNRDFSYQPRTEHGKKPDFLFPSEERYQDLSVPDDKLRMLAVKTTCKDRWRQVLNEADRVTNKHLLTLQACVSENQFAEMQASNISLVVPTPNLTAFPESIRPHLQSLESFIADVRLLSY